MKLITTLFLLLTSNCFAQSGVASWYGKENKVSCTGKRLQHYKPAAAHKSLPIGSKVKITSVKTKKTVIAVIEDRGPYSKNRIIDLNLAAAKQLGMTKRGIEKVTVEVL